MYYNGIQSDSSIVVVVRSDNNGDCVLTLSDGQTDTVTVATVTNYGHGRLEITGLSADTLYTYTVTLPDGSGGIGQIKTFKSDGGEKLSFSACENNDEFPIAYQVAGTDSKCHVILGDESYTEDPTFTTVASALDPAEHNSWRKGMREKSEKMYMAQRQGFGIMTDDHDTFLNDLWDDSADPPVDLNAILIAHTPAREAFASAAEWTTCKGVIADTMENFHMCNPSAVGTTDIDPFYYAFDCGNIRVIVPAMIMRTKTDMRLVNDGLTPILNPEQLAWLKNELNTTTKKFKLILSQKTTRVATISNADGWKGYSDLDSTLQWISDNSSGFSVPGGVVFGSGDWHSPGSAAYSVANGDAYDHVIINPCSSGRITDTRDPGAYLSTTLTAIRPSEVHVVGNLGKNGDRFLCFGAVESTDEYIEIKAILSDGSSYTTVRVNAGTNYITKPPVVVAI